MNYILERQRFLQIINETYSKYFKHGSRSSKKVDCFHLSVTEMLENYFPVVNGYKIVMEYNVLSCNSANRKKCDIVILKNNKPYIIFPVKIIMTNYKQNKNNAWENLTGEVMHIKWSNPDIHIIPINVLMDKTPYLDSKKKITNFEIVTHNDIKNYNELITHNVCFDVINYIVEVEHINKKNEHFDAIQPVTKFHTHYRSFGSILETLM